MFAAAKADYGVDDAALRWTISSQMGYSTNLFKARRRAPMSMLASLGGGPASTVLLKGLEEGFVNIKRTISVIYARLGKGEITNVDVASSLTLISDRVVDLLGHVRDLTPPSVQGAAPVNFGESNHPMIVLKNIIPRVIQVAATRRAMAVYPLPAPVLSSASELPEESEQRQNRRLAREHANAAAEAAAATSTARKLQERYAIQLTKQYEVNVSLFMVGAQTSTFERGRPVARCDLRGLKERRRSTGAIKVVAMDWRARALMTNVAILSAGSFAGATAKSKIKMTTDETVESNALATTSARETYRGKSLLQPPTTTTTTTTSIINGIP